MSNHARRRGGRVTPARRDRSTTDAVPTTPAAEGSSPASPASPPRVARGEVSASIELELTRLRAPDGHYLVIAARALARLLDTAPSAATARELRVTMERIADLEGSAEADARAALEDIG